MLLAGYVYFDDLRVLSQHSPSLRQPLPSMLCQVHTPLVIAEWCSQLCQHSDREFCQYLIDGLTNGFRIGFNYTSHRCQAAKRNMLSAVQNSGIVEQYLKKECELGRVVGPLVAGSIPLHINSLTTAGYLLEVFIRLWILSLVRISTSAWS